MTAHDSHAVGGQEMHTPLWVFYRVFLSPQAWLQSAGTGGRPAQGLAPAVYRPPGPPPSVFPELIYPPARSTRDTGDDSAGPFVWTAVLDQGHTQAQGALRAAVMCVPVPEQRPRRVVRDQPHTAFSDTPVSPCPLD